MDCPHDDDPNTCPPCVSARRKAAGKDVKPFAEQSGAFRAKHDGHCSTGCNLPISAGQAVQYVNGQVVHVWCS